MTIQHYISADMRGVRALAAGQAAIRICSAIVAAPFAAVMRFTRINRTAHQLELLDDRTLADIGLHRTQILSAATRTVDWPSVDPRRFSR